MEHLPLDQARALMALSGLPHIGPISIRRLLDHFSGDAVAVLKAPKSALLRVKGIGEVAAASIADWSRHFDLAKAENHLQRHGAAFITTTDSEYPRLLREIHDPPPGLYWRGSYRLGEKPAIAIVGTRRPTLYGRTAARAIAKGLVLRGYCVVSGLARGIDTEAHHGALEARGKTIAVLGCGLDIVYPPENLDLFRKIAAEGALVSEFPFGRRADRQTFPMRNRIISGIAQGVVVIESAKNGGSLITARMAGEQGRTVFAVPGRIDQVSSEGCHELIRDGATLITSVDDILDELGYPQINLDFEGAKEADANAKIAGMLESLGSDERKIAEALADGGILFPDQIGDTTALTPQQVNAALLMLELRRLVAKRADGAFEKAF